MDRTDADRFAEPPTPITARLGGKEFSLAIQRKGKTAAFRRKLAAALGTSERLTSIVNTMAMAADSAEHSMADLPLLDIGQFIHEFITHGANDLLDLIYEYDPALAEHREWIDENAFDDECIDVLIDIIKVVFGPFLQRLTQGMPKLNS